jgi:NTE family protein
MVLGGGGAKCIAHTGAWQAVEEWGGEVTHVLGTSMGAVIGAALAAGVTPNGVIQSARALRPKDAAAVDILALVKGVYAASLLKPGALRSTIARLVPATSFGDLRLPLTVTTTDMDTGDLVLFGAPVAQSIERRHAGGDAPLQDILYASCALPLYFPPARIAGRLLADGGLRAVVPLELAAGLAADVVVAVDVGPGFDETAAPGHRSPLPPLVRAHDSAIRIMMAAQTTGTLRSWPETAPRLVPVRAVAEKDATFAVGQAERYFTAGYETTQRALRATFGA